ncbi:box C/D snoRNA protein 1-like isoform X2 [Xenia sp. Carnegie-2017]|uniref:box C/D snoRNA protein 1-like isoform X2 n=1 Tax=Xenia sp. Carnegie-2017 TaxID=2897299 RepID=UPI001F038349|nr:box C/D snoRNA protein 1-like isoform X2 [Xenia sp. Carnegie-2017]
MSSQKMPNPSTLRLCSSCGSDKPKYCCPRCEAYSCSLICVKKHKVQESCSGQRDKAKFIAKSNYNTSQLLQDYRFLEEAGRIADNAQRDNLKKFKFYSNNARKLKNVAIQHGVHLQLMPVGFKKRTENTSFFHFKTKAIMWRVRWEFPQARTYYIDERVSENQLIDDLLEKYLHETKADPIIKHKLKIYGKGEIGVFLNDHSTQSGSFHKIETSMTLRDVLAGKVIIEYPTFHVVLPTYFTNYSTIISGNRQKLESEFADHNTTSAVTVNEDL